MKKLAALVATAFIGATSMAAAQDEPRHGGTLQSVLWPEPPGIMTGIYTQSSALRPTTKIFESLLTYDFNLNPHPNLASSWDISPDGLKYTFKLRENVRWHDGEPFTADDVVFTYGDYLLEVHPRARTVFERTEVSKVDDYTVTFDLKEPFAPLIRSFDLCCLIVPEHLYKGTDYRENPNNLAPIGTGPFKFDEWKRGEYIHLVRNENYWVEGQPYLDDIYYRFVPDAASRALALETGQMHLATQNDLEVLDTMRLVEMPHLDMTTKGWEWGSPIVWIEMNLRKEPFNDKRFRKAMSYALDRNFFRDVVFQGMASVATGPVHSASPFYEADVTDYSQNLDKAKVLLDEMGLTPDANGVRTTVKLLGLPYGEVWNRAAEYTRQALREIGVEVILEPSDPAGWAARTRDWDFEMTMYYLTTMGDPALGVTRTFLSDNQKQGVLFTNHAGYSNAQVDEYFRKAAVSVDENERRELYSKAQKILVDDAAVLWLVELEWPTVFNTKLRNAVTTASGPNGSFADTWLAE